MNTIIVKGIDYSVLETRALTNSKIKDINLLLVYPSGNTLMIQTDQHKLASLTDDVSSLIYPDQEFSDLLDLKNECLLNSFEGSLGMEY